MNEIRESIEKAFEWSKYRDKYHLPDYKLISTRRCPYCDFAANLIDFPIDWPGDVFLFLLCPACHARLKYDPKSEEFLKKEEETRSEKRRNVREGIVFPILGFVLCPLWIIAILTAPSDSWIERVLWAILVVPVLVMVAIEWWKRG